MCCLETLGTYLLGGGHQWPGHDTENTTLCHDCMAALLDWPGVTRPLHSTFPAGSGARAHGLRAKAGAPFLSFLFSGGQPLRFVLQPEVDAAPLRLWRQQLQQCVAIKCMCCAAVLTASGAAMGAAALLAGMLTQPVCGEGRTCSSRQLQWQWTCGA
jgi:hypothetical protein